MARKRWIALGVATLFAGGVVGAGYYAPTYVRHQIEAEHPGIKVGSVHLSRAGVDLRGIHITKEWVNGSIDQAFVTWDKKHITAHGGSVSVDLDKKPQGGHDDAHQDLVVDGLEVTVTKGTSTVTFEHTQYDGVSFDFDSGSFTWQDLSGSFKDGTFDIAKRYAAVSEASVKTDAHHIVPGTPILLKMIGVDLKNEQVSVDSIDLDALDPRAQPFHLGLQGIHISQAAGLVGVQLDSVSVAHPWLNPTPVTFHRISANVDRKLDFSSGIDVSVSDVHIHVDPANLEFSGKAGCQAWAEALPDGLRDGPLQTPAFTGEMAFDVLLQPKPKVKITSSCKMSCTAIQTFKKPFKYTAYNAKNEPVERTSGPGSVGWTPLSGVTPDMATAVINMEDPGFPYHKGYIPEAFENSFSEDLKKGSFARGGSTITMQLAKNVWLNRHKTLGRKAEELLLTMGLESCLSKDQIMELYLNVVEFGPDLYGIGPAARHYFHTGPMDLTPDQAFYLASILPHPKTAPPPNGPTMDRIKSLMRLLAKNGKIPDAMLLEIDQPDTTGWDSQPADTSGWQ